MKVCNMFRLGESGIPTVSYTGDISSLDTCRILNFAEFERHFRQAA